MKVNAPEKIYIDGCSSFAYETTDDSIEYIRKDAFIEKVCSWLKENKDKYLYNTGERDEYIPTCSSKIIDEFRAYMEGE